MIAFFFLFFPLSVRTFFLWHIFWYESLKLLLLPSYYYQFLFLHFFSHFEVLEFCFYSFVLSYFNTNFVQTRFPEFLSLFLCYGCVLSLVYVFVYFFILLSLVLRICLQIVFLEEVNAKSLKINICKKEYGSQRKERGCVFADGGWNKLQRRIRGMLDMQISNKGGGGAKGGGDL